MQPPSERIETLAQAAALLPSRDRQAFVSGKCGNDQSLVALVLQRLAEIDRQLLQTLDDVVICDPLESLGGRPDEGLETCDAVESHPQQPEMDATLAPDAESRHEEIANSVEGTLLPEQISLHESICDSFTAAWDRGSEPRIVDFIPAGVTSEIRDHLVLRLVLIDLEQRARVGRPVSDDHYLSQLPHCQAAIRSAMTQRSRSIHRSKNSANGSGPLETTAPIDGPSNNPPSLAARSRERIRYQPIKMHARGGLGAVYRAKDVELRRMVALKSILPAHENNPNSRARFIFEAEVTGSLEHPGIVPVYGLSQSEAGHPFYAMRFIRGESFSKAIRNFHRDHQPLRATSFNSREFRQLLRRLIDVCNAIHYAHERGVLHRDLKPDNVMLGRYGETLVVDWGLAKLISSPEPVAEAEPDHEPEQPLTLSDSGLRTSIGQAVGTPMYMSLEQACGMNDRLTPASDVHSLGAILFNIVSNEHPVDGKTSRDVIANVRQSRLRDLVAIVPEAPRPIVSICRKAMARDANDRYPTAQSLADDIDRWLSDEQVVAHAPVETRFEKAGRLIRRYRGWTVSGAIGLIAITVISIIATLLIGQARRSEQIAKVRATEFKEQAVERYQQSREAIDTWLVQSNDALQFFPGTQSIRRRLLEAASADYAKLADADSEDPLLELERGRTLVRLGDIQQLLEELPKARELYEQAEGVFDRLAALDEPTVSSIARVEAAGARMRTGLAFARESDQAAAADTYAKAATSLRRLPMDAPGGEASNTLATTLINWSESSIALSRYDEAEQQLEEAIGLLDSRVSESTSMAVRLSQSRAEELLSRLRHRQGQFASALDTISKTIPRLSTLVEANADQPEYLDTLASALVIRASIERSMGRTLDEAISLESAIGHYRALAKAIPDLPVYIENLSLTLTDHGLVLLDSDRASESFGPLEESLQLMSDLARRYGDVVRYESQIAATLDAIGQASLAMGDRTAARTKLEQSVSIYQQLFREFSDQTEFLERLAIALSHYAQAQEDPAASRADFNTAIDFLQQLVEADPSTPQFQVTLGHVYYEAARAAFATDPDRATELYQKANETWSPHSGDNPNVSERLGWMFATCPLTSLRDTAKSIEYAKRAYDAVPENVRFRSTLALSYAIADDAKAAASLMEATRSQSPHDARTGFTLAIIDVMLGEADQAETLFDSAQREMNTNASHHADLAILRDLAKNAVTP